MIRKHEGNIANSAEIEVHVVVVFLRMRTLQSKTLRTALYITIMRRHAGDSRTKYGLRPAVPFMWGSLRLAPMKVLNYLMITYYNIDEGFTFVDS